ncbi:MAG: MATE family efflux transporter [Pedobacter sp.]|nr:MAG: MATE family efflux transporter [Pedobacter sp.]
MKRLYLKYKPHYQANLKLAVPVIISQLGHILVQTMDSVIVGHFAGTIALAAVSLVSSIFLITLVIGIGIAYGLTPLVAQENGRENYEECGRLLSNSLFINILTGIFLYILVYFGSLSVIDYLGQSPGVVYLAKPYLALLSFSIIPLMIFLAFKQFAEGLGFTKQAMNISIWGNVLNIIIGVILVKGMFGIKPMGVVGVGIATLVDRVLMMVVMMIFVIRSKRFTIYLKSFVWQSVDKLRAIKLLKIGAPVALQYTFEVGAFGGAAILVGTVGAIQQAAHQVAISLASMTYMMASGVSTAATVSAGHNYGKKNFKQLHLSAISNYHIMLILMTTAALVFVILNQYLPWIYTTDESVIAIAAQLLIIAGFFQLFDGAQVVGLGILRGIGDVNIPTIITFIAYWVIGLPSGYYFGIVLELGVLGIWYGLTLGLLVSAGLLFFRFHYYSQKMISERLGLQEYHGEG